MRPFFTVDPVETRIIQELKSWSALGLETPNDFFNDLPPCPFARKAWAEEKVNIIFKHENSDQALYSAISQYDDAFDVAILVNLYDLPESDNFHESIEQLNDVISKGFFIDRDMWLMGFHPHDEVPDFVDETMEIPPEVEVEQEYTLIFIQRLSKLQEAAYKLIKKGYYDNYLYDKDACLQYAQREQFYLDLRRTDNGTSEKESSYPDAQGWREEDAGWGTSEKESSYSDEEGWFSDQCQRAASHG